MNDVSSEVTARRLGISRQAVSAARKLALDNIRRKLRERGFTMNDGGVLAAGRRATENTLPNAGSEGNINEMSDPQRAANQHNRTSPAGGLSEADGALSAAKRSSGKKLFSNSPALVYVNEYGERDASIKPDTRGNLGRALAWAGNRDGIPRAGFEKFQTRAEQEGLVLDEEAFRAWLKAHKGSVEGGEHTVYFDKKSNRVIKITHPDVTGEGVIGHPKNIRGYLTNLYLQNQEFADDVRLEGLVNLYDAPFMQVVISQPWIKGGRPATLAEKKQYFANHGFVYDSKDEIFVKTIGGETLRVGDHDGDNVMARDTARGVEVMPIDTQLLPSAGYLEQTFDSRPDVQRPTDGTLNAGRRARPNKDENPFLTELHELTGRLLTVDEAMYVRPSVRLVKETRKKESKKQNYNAKRKIG
jgi:hypothetical protein